MISQRGRLAVGALLFFAPPEAHPQEASQALRAPNLKAHHWRELGPAITSGRITAFAVHPEVSRVIYAATASGGVWKTTNNGVTWTPVFDDQTTSTIGDVTVSPSNPDIVWVGTGEPNNRQSSSWGDGVYKSNDAGKTWTNMGLRDTLHIGRIVIHPTNPDIVYVAALGHLWGPNKERGLFRTMDGDRGNSESQEKASGVPHKDPCGIEVIPQKTKGCACKGRGKKRR